MMRRSLPVTTPTVPFSRRGFTLIELLVVIAIIGLLSTIATISLSRARTSTLDTLRLTEVRSFTQALSMYFNDNNHWPDPPLTFYPSSSSKCSFALDDTTCDSYMPCISMTVDGIPNDRNWVEDLGKYFASSYPPQDPSLSGKCNVALPPNQQSKYYYTYQFFKSTSARPGEFIFSYYLTRQGKADTPGEFLGCFSGRCLYRLTGTSEGSIY